MRRVGDALNMRPHAATDVQKKQDVHGQVFAGEVADLLWPTVLAQDEIGDAQPGDRAVVAVYHLGVHPNQRHVAAEYDVGVLGGEQSSGQGKRQRKYTAGHATLEDSLSIETRERGVGFQNTPLQPNGNRLVNNKNTTDSDYALSGRLFSGRPSRRRSARGAARTISQRFTESRHRGSQGDRGRRQGLLD